LLKIIDSLAKRLIYRYQSPGVPIRWIRSDRHSWLWRQIGDHFIRPRQTTYGLRIEELAQETNNLGPQPLWGGYGSNNIGSSTRTPAEVRTPRVMGNLYAQLVERLQPNIVVEVGTAFGVSGMYFLAGIESNKKGRLLTFEPNSAWRSLAIHNLSQISHRFDCIGGTFEESVDEALPKGHGIDLAFIDAIHTRDFVVPQLEIIIARSSNQLIVILDDINFSESMKECWAEISKDDRCLCSAELSERVGILELHRR
jgi:predicted O-methyltransferase YrrM